ncbi:MAG: formate/nitrite transporter family protein [Parvularculaceae bacterium]
MRFPCLVMGPSFSIALALVVFAGSELFTGYPMYMTHGHLLKSVRVKDVLWSCGVVWLGNLFGAILLSTIVVVSAIDIVSAKADLLSHMAEKKAHQEAVTLVARGMLCNWLVCLAIWTSARTSNDAAKLILIFLCLFAFIAAGFEHSVANMTVFSLALMSDEASSITMGDAAHNLFWVTLGNALSGSVFVAVSYWFAGGGAHAAEIIHLNDTTLLKPSKPGAYE